MFTYFALTLTSLGNKPFDEQVVDIIERTTDVLPSTMYISGYDERMKSLLVCVTDNQNITIEDVIKVFNGIAGFPRFSMKMVGKRSFNHGFIRDAFRSVIEKGGANFQNLMVPRFSFEGVWDALHGAAGMRSSESVRPFAVNKEFFTQSHRWLLRLRAEVNAKKSLVRSGLNYLLPVDHGFYPMICDVREEKTDRRIPALTFTFSVRLPFENQKQQQYEALNAQLREKISFIGEVLVQGSTPVTYSDSNPELTVTLRNPSSYDLTNLIEMVRIFLTTTGLSYFLSLQTIGFINLSCQGVSPTKECCYQFCRAFIDAFLPTIEIDRATKSPITSKKFSHELDESLIAYMGILVTRFVHLQSTNAVNDFFQHYVDVMQWIQLSDFVSSEQKIIWMLITVIASQFLSAEKAAVLLDDRFLRDVLSLKVDNEDARIAQVVCALACFEYRTEESKHWVHVGCIEKMIDIANSLDATSRRDRKKIIYLLSLLATPGYFPKGGKSRLLPKIIPLVDKLDADTPEFLVAQGAIYHIAQFVGDNVAVNGAIARAGLTDSSSLRIAARFRVIDFDLMFYERGLSDTQRYLLALHELLPATVEFLRNTPANAASYLTWLRLQALRSKVGRLKKNSLYFLIALELIKFEVLGNYGEPRKHLDELFEELLLASKIRMITDDELETFLDETRSLLIKLSPVTEQVLSLIIRVEYELMCNEAMLLNLRALTATTGSASRTVEAIEAKPVLANAQVPSMVIRIFSHYTASEIIAENPSLTLPQPFFGNAALVMACHGAGFLEADNHLTSLIDRFSDGTTALHVRALANQTYFNNKKEVGFDVADNYGATPEFFEICFHRSKHSKSTDQLAKWLLAFIRRASSGDNKAVLMKCAYYFVHQNWATLNDSLLADEIAEHTKAFASQNPDAWIISLLSALTSIMINMRVTRSSQSKDGEFSFQTSLKFFERASKLFADHCALRNVDDDLLARIRIYFNGEDSDEGLTTKHAAVLFEVSKRCHQRSQLDYLQIIQHELNLVSLLTSNDKLHSVRQSLLAHCFELLEWYGVAELSQTMLLALHDSLTDALIKDAGLTSKQIRKICSVLREIFPALLYRSNVDKSQIRAFLAVTSVKGLRKQSDIDVMEKRIRYIEKWITENDPTYALQLGYNCKTVPNLLREISQCRLYIEVEKLLRQFVFPSTPLVSDPESPFHMTVNTNTVTRDITERLQQFKIRVVASNGSVKLSWKENVVVDEKRWRKQFSDQIEVASASSNHNQQSALADENVDDTEDSEESSEQYTTSLRR